MGGLSITTIVVFTYSKLLMQKHTLFVFIFMAAHFAVIKNLYYCGDCTPSTTKIGTESVPLMELAPRIELWLFWG